MNESNKESVLSRWSRRKAESRGHQAPVTESDELPSTSPEASNPLAEPAAAEIKKPELTDEDMPPIDSLDENSDFSAFMSGGVSDELRNLALRKLFRAPVFNIRDGLDEYDEDYTYFEKLGDIVTCDMKHHIEMQEMKRQEALENETADNAAGKAADDSEVGETADPLDESELDDMEAEIDETGDSPAVGPAEDSNRTDPEKTHE